MNSSNATERRPNRRVRLVAAVLAFAAASAVAWWMFPGYCVRSAKAAFFAQDVQTAERWIVRGLRVAPDNPDLLLMRARWHRKWSRFEEMNRDLRRAVELGAERERLVFEQLLAGAQTGRIEPLADRLSDLLLAGEDLSEICDAYVRGCILQYRIDEARRMITLWKDDLPDDPQPYFLTGRLLEHHADQDEALREFEQAIERSDRHAPAAYNLARIQFTAQQYPEAIAAFQQAQAVIDDPTPTLVGQAECYLEMEQLDQAAAMLAAVRQDDPDATVATYRYLGDPAFLARSKFYAVQGKLSLANEKTAEAAAWFEQALENNPRDWRTRYLYAQALKSRGMIDQANAELKQFAETQTALRTFDEQIRIVQKNPADVAARYEIGRVMLEHISVAQGRIWLNSALQYDPDFEPALTLLREYEDATK